MRSTRFLLSFLFLLLPKLYSNARETVPVGVGRRDVTPDYPVRLSGYGSRKSPHESVVEKLWAKALAIGSDPVVLVTVDSIAIPDSITREVRERLREKKGLAPDRVVIASTHTHFAPQPAPDYAPFIIADPISEEDQKNMDRYNRDLIDGIEAAALDALNRQRKGRLDWNKGTVTFAGNRRKMNRLSWAGFGLNPKGPVDHDLPLLRVRDENGKILALLASYACHCTTMGGGYNHISGDWAGYAAKAIEANHPGSTAMIMIGCGADANPNPRGKWELAREHGLSLQKEVDRLLTTPFKPLNKAITTRQKTIQLPLDKIPGKAHWEQQAKGGGAAGKRAKHFLTLLNQGKALQTTVPYSITTWSFGEDLSMVFLPGEVVVDYAIRLKAESDADRLWINAYCNDIPGYIPSRRILSEGGYEADSSMIYYGKPTRFAPPVEDLLVSTVHDLLPKSYRAPSLWPDPLTPKTFMASASLHPSLQMDLVAAEPLIVDPVAIDWGMDGKLWVVEMRDYPKGMDGNWKPGGRIKFLEDENGDGMYDKSTLFLDNLPFPTGIKTWRKGVIICAAPDLIYAEDMDGDGKADKKETLITGFGTDNYHLRLNGPVWGLDNTLHIANGKNARQIHSLKNDRKYNISGRDFRYHPDTGVVTPLGGVTQYGRVVDDMDNAFGLDNSSIIFHYPMPDAYLRRNPFFKPPPTGVYIPEDERRALVYPIGKSVMRATAADHAGRITSACGLSIYRDGLLGDDFVGDIFVCEPAQNLITRRRIKPKGSTFTARRAPGEEKKEFLASADNWFRPVQSRLGPDGALWVIDMYRLVIEHPQWMPPTLQAKVNLRAGDDKGRIYRIFPKGVKPRSVPRIDKMTSTALAKSLDHPNGTWRNLVHEELVNRQDLSAMDALNNLKTPLAKAHALWVLKGMGKLRPDHLERLLKENDPALLKQAIRLSESWLESRPQLGEAMLKHIDHPNATVRKQLAFSLGFWPDRQAGEALVHLMLNNQDDPYLKAAVLSSSTPHAHVILEGLFEKGSHLVEPFVATLMGDQKDPIQMAALLDRVLKPKNGTFSSWQFNAAATLLQSNKTLAGLNQDQVGAFVKAANLRIHDDQATERERVSALRIFHLFPKENAAMLAGLLNPKIPITVQKEAIAILAASPQSKGFEDVLARWNTLSPDVKDTTASVALQRDHLSSVLLDAIEKKYIPPASLSAVYRDRLLHHKTIGIKDRAAKVFGASRQTSPEKISAKIEALKKLTGRVAEGQKVFEKVCAICHPMEGAGRQLGPDLRVLTDFSSEFLLTAIFDPNQAVEPRYLNYQVDLQNNETLVGLITDETGNSLTLHFPDGRSKTILRNTIKTLSSLDRSMMPEGLEASFESAQQLADLLAYLQNQGPPRKKFENNQPRLITQSATGEIMLPAAGAEIYGPSLVFEQKYKNLGYWNSPADYARWQIEVKKAGSFKVNLDFACINSRAGNVFLMKVGNKETTGSVPGTTSWDVYQQTDFGTLDLEEGQHQLIVRSKGAIKGSLFDLRTIRLVPIK